ncbi:MAG: hypothetical protein KGP14_01850 [Betaproteobacteria bacterium]|nr:hypothetical protein [Betaproteobacteria bacterium]
MAQNPDLPLDNGKIGLPKVDAGMNKIAPKEEGGGRGTKDGDAEAAKAKKEAEKKKQEILARARKRMERCISAEGENRKQALDDLKFLAGEQWPADVIATRNADKRPMLTINKLPTFLHQVTNDQRQNRPAINISPVGNRSDVDAAKCFRGWIRAIERDSTADIAYDTAFWNSAGNGFGYWRVLSEYQDSESFDQVLRIKRVRNPFTVYLDPDSQEPDGADCRYGFVTEMIPREEFEHTHPHADPMPWSQSGIGEDMKAWMDQKTVRIAEYYEIELELRDLVALENGHVGFEDDLSPEIKQAIADGRMKVLKRRKAECYKQTWYKLTAKDILDTKPWPGRYVPIVKVIGDEMDIQGKVRYSGLIRFAKDPMRMYNYWSTAETEMIALAPKAPFIMEEGQVEGHEQQWKQANTKSYPYLLYKGTSVSGKPAPPPQRQPFAGSPQGIVQAKLGAAQDMMATTGIRFDATMNERMHDESGRAIRELRRSGDLGSFHYVDNLARALKHTGAILIDLAPHYLDTKRYVTVLREDDSEEVIQIDPHAEKAYTETKGQDGKTLKVFNPKAGKYSVTVTIGPSYATKRIEAAESMMAFAKAMPNVAQLVADLIAKNQDWPGADEMARRLAKAVPANLLTPDQKDIPPQVQAVIQAMDAQVKQLSSERQQLMAALNDKQADRAVAQDKINKDFEAKLYAILQKAEDSLNDKIGQRLEQAITAAVTSITQPAGPAGTPPPLAG